MLATATSVYPDDEGLWLRMGDVLLTGSDLDEARKALDHALELHPHYAPAVNRLGYIDALEKAIALRPEDRQAVAGEYLFEPMGRIRVLIEGEQLLAQAPGSPPRPMVPLSNSRFVVWDPEDEQVVPISFRSGEGGHAEWMDLTLGGKRMRGRLEGER